MTEKHNEHGLDLYMLFIDIKQAFDSINREGLLGAMDRMGITQKGCLEQWIEWEYHRRVIWSNGQNGNTTEANQAYKDDYVSNQCKSENWQSNKRSHRIQ